MMTTQEKNKTLFNTSEKLLIGIALILLVFGFLVFIGGFILFAHKESFHNSLKINDSKLGNLGSFLSGVVGATWSLVGVLLFYLALRLQRKELEFQRQELELTRGELQGQREQMVLQNASLSQQRFENTFFQLMTIHSSIVNAMDLRKSMDKSQVIAEGRDCFEIFYQRLRAYIVSNSSSRNSKSATLEESINGYIQFFEANQNDLGHYFRNLYHIVKFVDKATIDSKKTYTSFVRAQLSSNELALLFYNCLATYGREKFKPLIDKYELLKNMDTEMVFNQQHLKEYALFK